LKRARSQIILIIALASIILVYSPPPARADASLPTLKVGDHWTYSLTGTASGLSLSLTLTTTITGAEPITLNGNTYDAYRMSATSSGSATGPTLTASVTQTGYSLLRRSDLAGIAGLVSTSFSANGLTFTQIQNQTSSPPAVNAKFPLYLNEQWSTTVTTTTNQTTIPPTGIPTVITYSNTTTTSYLVTSVSLTTVPGGTYDTYLIRSSDPTGSSETYYSSEVLQPIKVVSYNSTGAVTTTVQLQSFDAWPYSTPFTANNAGTSYNLILDTDISATNIAQNPTSVSFQVNGTDGVTGRANITIPRKFNSTDMTVKVDSTPTTTRILEDTSNYYVYFTFPLSTHTITLTYATAGLPWLIIIGIIAAVGAVVAIATLLILRQRKPAEQTPPGPEFGPAQPPAPPPTPGESPAPLGGLAPRAEQRTA